MAQWGRKAGRRPGRRGGCVWEKILFSWGAWERKIYGLKRSGQDFKIGEMHAGRGCEFGSGKKKKRTVYKCMFVAESKNHQSSIIHFSPKLPSDSIVLSIPPLPFFPTQSKTPSQKPLKTSNPTQSPAQSSATHPPHSAHPYLPSRSNKSQYPSPRPSPLPARPRPTPHAPSPTRG